MFTVFDTDRGISHALVFGRIHISVQWIFVRSIGSISRQHGCSGIWLISGNIIWRYEWSAFRAFVYKIFRLNANSQFRFFGSNIFGRQPAFCHECRQAVCLGSVVSLVLPLQPCLALVLTNSKICNFTTTIFQLHMRHSMRTRPESDPHPLRYASRFRIIFFKL